MKKAKRTGLAANPATASGLVKASKIADRIQAFLEKLAAKGIDLLEDAVEDQQQLVSYLADILEEHSARHVSIINKLSKAQGFGPTSAAKIQKALAKAQAGRAKGNTITESAKKKSGLGKGNGTGKKGKSVFGLKTTIARGKVQATAKESPRTQGRDAPTTPATLTAEVRPVLKQVLPNPTTRKTPRLRSTPTPGPFFSGSNDAQSAGVCAFLSAGVCAFLSPEQR